MKKTSVFPWTATETDWLVQSIKDHPDWSNQVRYHHLRKALPDQRHTRKATNSKINTLRINPGKSKWNAIALNTLAQLVSYEVPRSEMATYFGVSEAAIAHQLHKLKNLGMLKQTPIRKVNAHERMTLPEILTAPCMKPVEQVKQLKFDMSKIRAIDESVEKLIADTTPRTATEMLHNLDIAKEKWQAIQQETLLMGIVQVADHVAQLMSNTLQLIKEQGSAMAANNS